MYDLLIENGTLVTDQGEFRADIAVKDGAIAAMGTGLGRAAERFEAYGLHVLPGLVDLHVHFREPGMEYKEDFGSGSTAAAVGGVTTVFEMPNTIPPTATAEDWLTKQKLVSRHAFVDYGIRGAILPANAHDLAPLVEVGACSFKLFMGETVGNYPCPEDGAIFSAFRQAAALDIPIGCHAENNSVLQLLKNELKTSGRRDPLAHLESRPPFIEQEAVARACVLAAAAGNQLHIHHLSTGPGLDALRWGRKVGARVTAEVLIGHLLLDASRYEIDGNLVQLNPPIRPSEHVQMLWAAIEDGTINAIATDHAPHTLDEQGADNVWDGHGGFIGVETLLPLLTTQVVNGRLSLPRLVELASTNPAKIQKVYPKKGSLTIGADADLVLIDMQRRYQIDQSKLHSKHNVSPYHGWEVQGLPIRTYLRGSCVAADGELADPLPAGNVITPRDFHRHGGHVFRAEHTTRLNSPLP